MEEKLNKDVKNMSEKEVEEARRGAEQINFTQQVKQMKKQRKFDRRSRRIDPHFQVVNILHIHICHQCTIEKVLN